ncbi:MAG: alpha/beta hydrolase [Acidobacteria bacterium]|nr:alpha/beta hydrolase [Acidobacteriota bacterium]
MTATVNGVQLAYSDTGHGHPLVCLHGGMGVDAGTLRVPGILDLARHGIRVIIPDQRGHGQSARDSELEYSHDTWATDANDFAECLGFRRFALLGHSYGGFLALEYAVRWPASLTHLILVATSAGPVRAQTAKVATDAELREHFRAVWPGFFVGEHKYWSLFETLHFAADPYNAAFTRELPVYDLRDRVCGLRVPALLVVGSEDPYRPHMEWLAEQMPAALLCVFEGIGHFPFVEAATEFTRSVATFLNRRRQPAA